MIWFIIALVALAAIAILSWPLLKKPVAAPDRATYDLTVFQDQLKEVDRDVERGVLTEEEAGSARLEIQRRILAVEKAPTANETPTTDSRWRRVAIIGLLIVAVPALAAGIYLKVGTPNIQTAEKQGEEAEMNQMLEQLAARVAQAPDDIEAATLLARSYAMVGRFTDSVNVFKKVVELDPNAENYAGFGEATVFAADGKVGKDGHDAFVRALTIDRGEPRAQFYLGIEQNDLGKPQNAIAIWRELTDGAPAEAQWATMVKEKMAEVATTANLPPMTVVPQHALDFIPREEVALARVMTAGPMAPRRAPPAAAASTEMTPETKAKVEQMVAGLATRLEASPDDYNGWMMLGRSYVVLKNFDGAKTAYGKAVALKPTDLEPRMQYLASLMTTVDVAGEGALPQYVTDATASILQLDPKQPDALYVSGLAKVRTGDKEGARAAWTQALATMPADSPLKAYVERGIQSLE